MTFIAASTEFWIVREQLQVAPSNLKSPFPRGFDGILQVRRFILFPVRVSLLSQVHRYERLPVTDKTTLIQLPGKKNLHIPPICPISFNKTNMLLQVSPLLLFWFS